MRARTVQRGSVLIISLVFMVMLTMIAVSAIQTTTGMVQIVGNAQFREESVAAGQQAIDQLIGSVTSSEGVKTRAQAMNNPTTTVDINGDGSGDYSVSFDPLPACLSRSDAKNYVDNQIVIERNTAIDTSLTQAVRDAASARYALLRTCLANKDLPNQCYWSLWRVTAGVTDTFTGTSATVTQGVRVLIGLDDKVNNCE